MSVPGQRKGMKLLCIGKVIRTHAQSARERGRRFLSKNNAPKVGPAKTSSLHFHNEFAAFSYPCISLLQRIGWWPAR
jgi:hypothetical protein